MRFHRPQRVSSLIKEELNKIILRELEFNDAVMTIVEVDVSDKLEGAVVKFAVYPPHKGPDVLLRLVKRRDHLQFLLLRKINIKPMPKIIFQLAQ